ncbi:MAG TPA: homoserine O-acetyltransferase [Candidatus Limnocylindrales bacterium]|nr:homoserine O-acetyltransferase [Candidatus Limnocylindrales bacterium]
MTDPLNVCREKQGLFDGPDSPRSVGWTTPQRVVLADQSCPLPLDCGVDFFPVTVEYETYGNFSEAKDNAVFLLHALSGDAHIAGWDADWEKDKRPWRRDRPGWWDQMVGPGKAFNTDLYYVVCANLLGSCYGTTGPWENNPLTGKPYGLDFPVVTVQDWVRLQVRLQDYLGIDKLLAVAGGSLGGQQALAWAMNYPERVRSAIIMAASARLSAQGLAFNAVGRQAIMNDPCFQNGNYYDGKPPANGLELARMLGHITYLSYKSMEGKFGRRYENGSQPGYHLDKEFSVESYLEYQGRAFVRRFDANSYLYLTRAMDYFDAASAFRGNLAAACAEIDAKLLLLSFSSDWLYPPRDTREIAKAMLANNKSVTYVELLSDYGHDAFLLETDRTTPMISSFLGKV